MRDGGGEEPPQGEGAVQAEHEATEGDGMTFLAGQEGGREGGREGEKERETESELFLLYHNVSTYTSAL